MRNLKNYKHIVITGGGDGLGKEIAEYFEKTSKAVIIIDKSINKKKFIETQGKYFFIKNDLRNTNSIISSLKKILKSNKINLLINNAKLGKRLSFEKESLSNFNSTFSINLTSHFFLIQKLIKFFKQNDEGSSIINISSVAASSITNESPSYHFSKNAMVSMTKYIAYNLGKKNIRCNCIIPGFIIKKKNLNKYYSKNNKNYKKIVKFVLPSKSVGYAKDIFNVCDFLMNPNSKFINGEKIHLDGGSHTTQVDPFNLLIKYNKI